MKRSTTIIILTVLISSLSVTSFVRSGVNSTQKQFGIEPFVPMPSEFIDEVGNEEFGYNWTIYYDGHDSEGTPVTVIIDYIPERTELRADVSYMDQSYSYLFPTVEPFIVFTDYLSQHEDVFFNHEEYDYGEDTMSWRMHFMQEDVDEFFRFQVKRWEDESGVFHAICKWGDAAEVREAMDLIRELFIDEIVNDSNLD